MTHKAKHALSLVLPALLCCALLPCQNLRQATVAADIIVVATDIGVRPLGKSLLLHRLRVISTLKGDAPSLLTVPESKQVAQHVRPGPGETRLYCLHDFDERARRLGLPQSQAPYFTMSGYQGSNPAIADHRKAPAVEFARIILAAQANRTPQETCSALLRQIFTGPPTLRLEAAQALVERPILRRRLSPFDRSQLMALAVGEIKDIPFKIAVAELCAEDRMQGLVDALCRCIDEVADPRFAASLGRIAKVLHGESATEVLRPHLLGTQRQRSRSRLILALGATETQSARQALLRMRETDGPDADIDAALKYLR
ncbi:MAG: hypothetical protein QF412_15410 [Planctomycetota bacterium]|jgi:hypothetical protein|nr:hypothetical protein [Planctomycetota bacterium]